MKSVVFAAFAAIGLSCVPCFAENFDTTVLQGTCVLVKAGNGQGSGTLVSRGGYSFCWTAAHVVDALRKERKTIENGVIKTRVEFADCEVVLDVVQNGAKVGAKTAFAKVLKFSDADYGHDLCLLFVRQRGFSDACATFADSSIPKVGSELVHVGCLYGAPGSCSVTFGHLSYVGRVLDLGPASVVFDQTDATTLGGSSGGGLFYRDSGKYVGMLVRGYNGSDGFNLMVPVRRMWEFARNNDVVWALDPSVELPSLDTLEAIPVEDVSNATPGLNSTAEPTK